MPLRPCSQRGCPKLVASGYCPEHAERRARAKLSSPRRAVYDDPRWRRCREFALERAGYRCEQIIDGERCPQSGTGLHADHYPHGVLELLAAGADPFNPDTVVIRCPGCHGRRHAHAQAQPRRRRR